MPATLPSLNSVTIAEESLARLVAYSTTFQEVVSCMTSTEAYEHVYWPEANDYDPDNPEAGPGDPWPRAIVTTLEWGAMGLGPGQWRDSGTLGLSFEFAPPAPYLGNRRDEALWFNGKWGSIIAEMFAARGQHDGEHAMLHWTSIQTLFPPMPVETGKDLGYVYAIALGVQWQPN